MNDFRNAQASLSTAASVSDEPSVWQAAESLASAAAHIGSLSTDVPYFSSAASRRLNVLGELVDIVDTVERVARNNNVSINWPRVTQTHIDQLRAAHIDLRARLEAPRYTDAPLPSISPASSSTQAALPTPPTANIAPPAAPATAMTQSSTSDNPLQNSSYVQGLIHTSRLFSPMDAAAGSQLDVPHASQLMDAPSSTFSTLAGALDLQPPRPRPTQATSTGPSYPPPSTQYGPAPQHTQAPYRSSLHGALGEALQGPAPQPHYSQPQHPQASYLPHGTPASMTGPFAPPTAEPSHASQTQNPFYPNSQFGPPPTHGHPSAQVSSRQLTRTTRERSNSGEASSGNQFAHPNKKRRGP